MLRTQFFVLNDIGIGNFIRNRIKLRKKENGIRTNILVLFPALCKIKQEANTKIV